MSDTSDQAMLRDLVKSTKLLGMHAVGFSAQLEAEPPEPKHPVEVAADIAASPFLTEDGFRFVFHFMVTAGKEGESKPFVRFKYDVLARYQAPADLCKTEAVRRAYAENVALLQVWPFVRHFVQSSCVDLFVPIVVLPIIQANSIKLGMRTLKDQVQPPPATPAE